MDTLLPQSESVKTELRIDETSVLKISNKRFYVMNSDESKIQVYSRKHLIGYAYGSGSSFTVGLALIGVGAVVVLISMLLDDVAKMFLVGIGICTVFFGIPFLRSWEHLVIHFGNAASISVSKSYWFSRIPAKTLKAVGKEIAMIDDLS